MIMRMSSRQMRSKWEKTNFAIYVKKWGAFCDLVYYDLGQTDVKTHKYIDFVPTWDYNIFCVVLSFFIMRKE